MYKLEEALKAWEEAGKYGSYEDRVATGRLWMPYFSYISEKCAGKKYTPNANVLDVAEYFGASGLLDGTKSFLDIGCGVGNYSLTMAQKAGKVTAIDVNPDCLKVLNKRAAELGLDNITTVDKSWEYFDTDEQFDVSFSAMCPAICNMTDIEKIEKMTKDTVAILTVGRGSYEKCRMELMKGLKVVRPGGMVTEALHYYNVLYLSGRRPEIKNWTTFSESSDSVEDMIEKYVIYLKIFGINASESLPYLQEFFTKRAVNGIVSDECLMNYSMVLWHPKK